MKRKYLSALLMGTLTVASMSTFTSCKDYDDDISNLQGQIDKLATADELAAKVSELQSLISSNKSDISSLQSELAKKTTLDEVKAVLANYAEKKYVDDAVATLDAAVKAQGGDITALQAAVKAAQDAADKAATDAKAANEEILKTLETLATKAEVEEVKAAAKAANDAIEALKANDIKTLQTKQNEILESLKTYAKQESLDKVAAKAEALQTALDKKADTKALTKAEEELNAAIAEVKSTAGKNAAAIEGLATTVKNAKDALALAQANQTKLAEVAASLKDSSKEGTVAAAIKAIQAQIGTPDNKLGSLDSRLALIESVLNGGKDDDTKLGLATKVTKIENQLRDIIGEYTTMVTAVDLFKTDDAYRFSNGLPDGDLTFIWVPSEHTTKFPANKNLTDAQIEFSADHKNITITDSLVVRVSPTNAELTPANISLINSQGKELNEFVDVQSVKPYKKLVTGATRAANATEGNGLWTVTFKLKDGVDIQKFEEATISQNSYVQFAVAVKNTTSEAKESPRRVISDYSVDVKGSSYEPANNSILVQGNDDVWKNIRNVRNRFDKWRVYYGNNNYKDYTGARSAETGEKVPGVNELEWAGSTPYTAEEVAANNTQLAENHDKRAYANPLPVTVGKKINIALGAEVRNGVPYYYNTETGRGYAVKGFYVTLDKDFAIESAPSELNAWAKYSYENVGVTNSKGTITKAAHMFYGNEGYITINSLEDTEVKGDIIGFRVYAVNFDGTLVDPDGRAFYVKVGDAKDQQTVAEANATITATASGSQYFKRNGNESNFFANITTDAFNVGATEITDWTVDYTNNPGDLGNDPIKNLSYGDDFNVKYYNKKGQEVSITSGEVASAKVFLLRPQRFVDGGTYTIKATLSDNVHELRDVTLKFTKVMPTAKDIKALTYVDEKLVANNLFSNVDWTSSNIYKFSQNPANDGSIYEKVVSREMTDYVSGLVDSHYTLWFESLNVEQSKIAFDYSYSVDRKNIDGKEHAIKYAYDFGPISLTHSYVTGEWLTPSEYVINAESNLKMLFNTWLNKETWAWKKDYTPTLTWNAGVPVRNQKVSAANIIGANSLLGRFNDKSLDALFAAGYTQIAEKNGKPYVSFSNPAFDVTVDIEHSTSLGSAGNITFVFNQTTKTTVPDTSGTLTIGVEDCFGQVKVITLGNIKIDRQ